MTTISILYRICELEKDNQDLRNEINALKLSKKIHADNYSTNNSNIMQQIKELQENYRGLFHDIAHIEKKHEQLEQKTEMMRDTTVRVDRAYDEACQRLEERIYKLENENKRLTDYYRKLFLESASNKKVEYISSRVVKIEEILKDHEPYFAAFSLLKDCEFPSIRDAIFESKKNPYKCPVCDGVTEISVKNPAEKDYQIANKGDLITHISACAACDGTGIVWG